MALSLYSNVCIELIKRTLQAYLNSQVQRCTLPEQFVLSCPHSSEEARWSCCNGDATPQECRGGRE